MSEDLVSSDTAVHWAARGASVTVLSYCFCAVRWMPLGSSYPRFRIAGRLFFPNYYNTLLDNSGSAEAKS